MNLSRVAALALLSMAAPAWAGPSIYLTAPADPRAVTVKAAGDGRTDDSAAIQAAIDKAAATPRRRHRVRALRPLPADAHASIVWRGVRLIGYGATRPVFVLGRQHARLPEGHRADGDVHRRASLSGPPPPASTGAVSAARQRAADATTSPTPDRARSIRR